MTVIGYQIVENPIGGVPDSGPLPDSHASERPDFDSYEEAIIRLRGNDELRKDTVDTFKSSGISAAEYYTDGSGDGFLILNMKGKVRRIASAHFLYSILKLELRSELVGLFVHRRL